MNDISIKANALEIRKKILSMILPITIESILQMTASFASMAMIGRIGPLAVSGLGISLRITQIIWALFKGVTTGASVFVAQAYGANDHSKLKKVIQQTLLSSVLLVLVLQQIIFWKAPQILMIFNPDVELLDRATLYLRTVSWGLPFVAIMLVVAGVLQGMGNAKTPMKIALMMNFLNIGFSSLLIFGNLGLPALGLKGAAISLALSQFIAAALGIYVLFNKNGVLGSSRNKNLFKLDVKQVLDVYKVGAPTALESIFWQLSAIILTRVILSYGELTLAAYQLGLQAESISYMPAAGFGIAATAFVGQAVGARDKELGQKYMKELVKGSFMLTCITAAILIFLPGGVMRLLTNDTDVISIGVVYLFVMGLVQIPQSMSGVLNGALRGAGFTRVPMIVAGAGLWGIRIPMVLLLSKYFNTGITAIWIIMGVDLIFRFILSFTLYKTRDLYSQELVIKEASA